MDGAKQCFEGDAKNYFAAAGTVLHINCPQVRLLFLAKILGRAGDTGMMFVRSPSPM